jgi:SHS2 domain-containing protein
MYEQFEHTADLGLRVQSPDLNTLFADAGRALTAAIVEDVDSIEPRRSVTLVISGEDIDFLLLDWLNALLMKFEVERLLFRQFQVEVNGSVLTGNLAGEPFDAYRHRLSHEVKAITYQGLNVEQTPEGDWLAEVVVDI